MQSRPVLITNDENLPNRGVAFYYNLVSRSSLVERVSDANVEIVRLLHQLSREAVLLNADAIVNLEVLIYLIEDNHYDIKIVSKGIAVRTCILSLGNKVLPSIPENKQGSQSFIWV